MLGLKEWRLDRVVAGVVHACCLVAAAALALMMLSTVVDVVLRWFGSGIPGIYELVTMGMRIVIPLALPYVFWTGGNVAVEVLTDNLPSVAANIILRLGASLGALVMALLTYAIARRAVTIWQYGQVSSDLALPEFYYWIPWIFGSAVCVPIALYLTFRSEPPQRFSSPPPS